MDYIFGSALSHFAGLALFIIGYDIACQWFVNLRERISKHWPTVIKLNVTAQAIPVIGKLHEPAHEADTHEQFSVNLTKWCGLSDFEVMERIWALHNALGNSIKTMGPGSYKDTMEAHFGFHNWEKFRTMGECFMLLFNYPMVLTLILSCRTYTVGLTLWSRYKEAMKERNRQEMAHASFSANLPVEEIAIWEEICCEWEDAPYPKNNVFNPYQVEEECKFHCWQIQFLL